MCPRSDGETGSLWSEGPRRPGGRPGPWECFSTSERDTAPGPPGGNVWTASRSRRCWALSEGSLPAACSGGNRQIGRCWMRRPRTLHLWLHRAPLGRGGEGSLPAAALGRVAPTPRGERGVVNALREPGSTGSAPTPVTLGSLLPLSVPPDSTLGHWGFQEPGGPPLTRAGQGGGEVWFLFLCAPGLRPPYANILARDGVAPRPPGSSLLLSQGDEG